MDFLTIVYLFYTFIAFYFLSLYVLLYFQNKKQINECFVPKKNLSISIVIPCYNEQDSIGQTIEHLLKSDYEGLKKIIVVDDCSKDNSFKIIQGYAKKYSQVIAVQTPRNTGNAAGAKNYGAKFADTDLIGFSDADSFANKDAISKMIGCFNDERVGAVTSRVLVKNRHNMLSKIQAIEYKIIAFTRKMLGFIDAIYVTNGPLSIYRKKAYDQIGGFDAKNLTEDIEITWHFVKAGWKVEMCIPAKVYTIVPDKVGAWFKQRVRWNVGGMQTIAKYRREFLKCGMLGLFILPFFVFSWIIGILGFCFLIYRMIGYVTVHYIATQLSSTAQVAVISMQDFAINPSILFYLGIVLLIGGFSYTLVAIAHSRENDFPPHTLFDIFIYSFFYLLMYPPLLVYSLYKYSKGWNTW